MIIAINYANERFKKAQKINTFFAKKYGADVVIEYNPTLIPKEFYSRNKLIFEQKRGAGLWLWKSYIINETLNKASFGDYVLYMDSGSCLINRITLLIDAMNKENTDIMCFQLPFEEKCYTKKDAFILMDCLEKKYTDSKQILGTYIIIRKSKNSVDFFRKFLELSQNIEIIDDEDCRYCDSSFKEYIDHREDQSIFSLLCKKNNIKPFRDPSEYGNDVSVFDKDVIARSSYPQVVWSHRQCDMGWIKYFYMKYLKKYIKPYKK